MKDSTNTCGSQCSHTVATEAREPHYHKDEKGILVKCYHECRNLLTSPAFWIGTTIGFPLEHILYKKIWPFTVIDQLLNL